MAPQGTTLGARMNLDAASKGAEVMEGLRDMSRDPMRFNRELLMRLLADNAGTEFGRTHGFAGMRSVDDFRRGVPLTVFDDYAGYIYRMTELGEEGLITAYPVRHYAMTSGTMGNPKRVPVSDRAMEMMERYNMQLRVRAICDGVGTAWADPPCVSLIESKLTTLRCGATYGAISAQVIGRLGDLLPQVMTSPPEALVPVPGTDTRYLHARFALMNRDVAYIGFSFSSIMLELMRYIEDSWEMLVDDIRDGTVDGSVRMPEDVRASVLSRLSPMPERAAEHREVYSRGFGEPVMPRIWPDLRVMCGVATGGFSSYHERLVSRYAGDGGRMLYVGLNASEGPVSAPVELDSPDSVLLPDAMFYEFLPIGSDDPEDVVTMDGVEVGGEYELIITNLSGLYRYRIRDAVRVTGMFGRIPTIRFLYRMDQTVSVLGEKTTEPALMEAAEAVERDMGYGMVDFSVYADQDSRPMRYVMYMEADPPEGVDREAAEAELDRRLREANPSYGDKVSRGMLGPMELRLLQPETYLLYRDLMVLRGASPSQLKPPRIVVSEFQRRFFDGLLEDAR